MRTPRPIPALAVAGLLLVSACGDDDDAAANTDTAAADATSPPVTSPAPPATSTPATSDPDEVDAPAETDATAYCQAHLDLEAAMHSEDPAVVERAAGAAKAAVPGELADSLETAIATSPTEEGPPDPAFVAAYGDVVDWISEHCGFAQLAVTATDYAFDGVGASVDGGPTVVQLANEGAEMHEIVIMRKNEGVTESFEEILAGGDEEAFGKVTFVGVAFAAPGETGGLVTMLEPGEHLAICFIPVGSTPDAMASGSMPQEAPPHFVHGMQQEFTVT